MFSDCYYEFGYAYAIEILEGNIIDLLHKNGQIISKISLTFFKIIINNYIRVYISKKTKI